MMKLTWKRLLCFALILATVFCLAACEEEDSSGAITPSDNQGDGPDVEFGGGGASSTKPSTDPTEKPSEPSGSAPLPPHTHDYTSTVVAPTCTEDGYTEYTCSCGDSYQSDVVAAAGHNYNDTVVTPTCVDQGYTQHICSVCENTYTDAFTEATGIHTIESQWRIWKGVPCHCCTVCDYAEYYSLTDAIVLADPARDFEKKVADAFIQCVNDYRASDGTDRLKYLPGMSQVAQYRSRQLAENYVTDPEAIREAHNYYGYGTYMDMTIYGQESYYMTVSNEGIGCYDMLDKEQKYTAEELAQNWVYACYNSTEHWAYVGSGNYTCVGIGVHYDDTTDLWYVCIMLSAENYE